MTKEQKKKIFIADINKDFIEKYGKDLIIIKNSFDFEKKIKNNLEQIKSFLNKEKNATICLNNNFFKKVKNVKYR